MAGDDAKSLAVAGAHDVQGSSAVVDASPTERYVSPVWRPHREEGVAGKGQTPWTNLTWREGRV